jgi:glutamyl-tRNA synthetase
VTQARPFFERPDPDAGAAAQLEQPGARESLAALRSLLEEGPLSAEAAQELLGQAATAAGVKKGVLMKSLRAALLGSLQGPDLLTTLRLLQARGDALSRLDAALDIATGS